MWTIVVEWLQLMNYNTLKNDPTWDEGEYVLLYTMSLMQSDV